MLDLGRDKSFLQWAFHDEAWLWVICPEPFLLGKIKYD
uniref:Uncharacterized protein n=1 Tax=Salmonella phage PMBT29 TaxID=3137286 RepID=A0AAU8BV42_9VIRU